MEYIGSVPNGAIRPSWAGTRTDDIMSSYQVFFRTCPATPRQGRGPCCPPGEMSHTSHPAAPRSSLQSPYSIVWKVAGDYSLFACHFCVLSFYPLVLYLLLPYCFLCFGVFPCHSLFSAVTQFGLMKPTIEMKLSGYHGCWVISSQWFITGKTLIRAGSCAREDISCHDYGFHASLLFSLSIIFPMYFPLWAILGYWEELYSIWVHSFRRSE